MAYAAGLGPVGGDTVGVQIPPPAPNVYMIDSQLLNVQSPKPTLSSLMLRLIARVRALT